MIELGLTNVAMFFVAAGISLIFIVAWVARSGSRINICKAEIRKLKSQIASHEREKFMLSERIDDLESLSDEAKGPAEGGKPPEEENEKSELLLQALEQNAALEKEKEKVRLELDEAKGALEEIYKAIAEKKLESWQ